jgi:hypothetical protein
MREKLDEAFLLLEVLRAQEHALRPHDLAAPRHACAPLCLSPGQAWPSVFVPLAPLVLLDGSSAPP